MARTAKPKTQLKRRLGITLQKVEYHTVHRYYQCYVNIDKLRQIFPDALEDDLEYMLVQLAEEDEDVINTIVEADFEYGYLEFEHEDDDWWSDRKGGYDIEYDVVSADYYETEEPIKKGK